MKNNTRPQVKEHDIIHFGSGFLGKKAVVSRVYSEDNNNDIEVVYLDERGRAIYEDMTWMGEKWEFCDKGPAGGYADGKSRFSSYIQTLKQM